MRTRGRQGRIPTGSAASAALSQAFSNPLFRNPSKFLTVSVALQVAARRFKTPHHYKTLGLAMGATEADIRK